MKKQMLFKTKGMNQDLSVSAFNPEFSFENMNLRLSTNEGNTLLSWVNEKGTEEITIDSAAHWDETTGGDFSVILGVPIGTAVINRQLVIFTHVTNNGTAKPDYIYKLKYVDETGTVDYSKMVGKTLYNGNLGFSIEHPLETLVSYESEKVQKVYWTDGVNQPRVINIKGDIKEGLTTQFDFIPTLQLNESITVEKQLGATGMFAPGVIQYCFTYYNKYGQESNIFYTTPLLYISYKERGGSPEDKIENAFKITVENVDTNFEYLRIYSVQRTSINATPICKRIQDIAITESLDWVDEDDHSKGKKAFFIDTGTTGDSIDPTELLFKGGEVISAETMSQKDDTLFMGNIEVKRQQITELKDSIKGSISLSSEPDAQSNSNSHKDTRAFTPLQVSYGAYAYANQLTSKGGEARDNNATVPCAGFKTSDYYRCGVQFQHKSGKWSDPVWVDDIQVKTIPSEGTGNDAGKIFVPIISGELKVKKEGEKYKLFEDLKDAGYKKLRPVVVFPDMIDRNVICQGVANPTMWIPTHRGYKDPTTEEDIAGDGDIYAQSSWFFRPYAGEVDGNPIPATETTNVPHSRGWLSYTQRNIEDETPDEGHNAFDPVDIRRVEIEGDFTLYNQFRVDSELRTLHSPDIEFDDQLQLLDFINTSYKKVGEVTFTKTLSDIDIQTESPTISDRGLGFVHKSFTSEAAAGIISGLFYDDFAVDDNGDKDTGEQWLEVFSHMRASAKWLVYPWQSNGSLNNDINRPADKGNQTAILKKKVISNLRYADTSIYGFNDNRRTGNGFSIFPQLFSSDEDTILKFNDGTKDMIYKGNIDTLLMPDNADGKYFASDAVEFEFPTKGNPWKWNDTKTEFTSTKWLKFFSRDADKSNDNGIRKWLAIGSIEENVPSVAIWYRNDAAIGNDFVDLVMRKSPVRMKYKSTPHLVIIPESNYSYEENSETDHNKLAIMEIQKKPDENTRFGGRSADAFRENKWLPCGIPVSLDAAQIQKSDDGKYYKVLDFYYDYGDTYFQRYDCLKTYAYTREDINQIVEIGSFMLETHVNIDGRYDRNRGQGNNLNMSPQNFNLLNPVYSQLDNFFTYRIQDDDFYKENRYPNQITWSKTKSSNADIDMWNNVTLASTLEMDGNKGEITSLQRLNDQLICFQDSGISQILYNENTQISTAEGVPIEIANSGKVQGKRYLSNTVGCSNKWSIVTTPSGLYFMDSNEKSIYRLGEGLQNISQQGGFNAWCKQHIPASNIKWAPDKFNNFVGYYDKKNQDVLFINNSTALAFSEKIGAFTSFYDYGNTPWFCNLDDTGIWIKGNTLWKHQAGEYCDFFSTENYDGHKPYGMTLVGNPEPQMDKIFTNLEFRACVEGDGVPSLEKDADGNPVKFTPSLPFTHLETWNEYQHGYTQLSYKNGHSAFTHHTSDMDSSLKRKFRIWRCDIPRNNCLLEEDMEGNEFYEKDSDLGISRHIRKPQDRMRNPWVYLKLKQSAIDVTGKTEIHDVMLTYFG